MTHFLLFIALSFGAGVISTVAVYLIISKITHDHNRPQRKPLQGQ